VYVRHTFGHIYIYIYIYIYTALLQSPLKPPARGDPTVTDWHSQLSVSGGEAQNRNVTSFIAAEIFTLEDCAKITHRSLRVYLYTPWVWSFRFIHYTARQPPPHISWFVRYELTWTTSYALLVSGSLQPGKTIAKKRLLCECLIAGRPTYYITNCIQSGASKHPKRQHSPIHRLWRHTWIEYC